MLPVLFRLQGLELNCGNAAEELARAITAQQRGETSLLIAFRHPKPMNAPRSAGPVTR